MTALIASSVAVATPAQASDELPILGQVEASSEKTTAEEPLDVLISVHGIRRVENRTMVYYSAGYTPDSAPSSGRGGLINAFGNDSMISPLPNIRSEKMGDVAILDVPGRTAYATMYTGDYTKYSDTDCLCQRWLDALPSEPEPGTAYAATAALPALPDDLDSVTIRVLGHFFTDIPVKDGPMAPTTDEEAVPVGMGWPEIDPEALNDVPDPSAFVLPLTTNEVVQNSALRERSDKDSRSLDLSADVLFNVDEATLTSKAKKEIKAASDRIKEAGTKGTITVIGHTDSDGAKDYNQNLSQRRAESVAKALKPLVASGVKLTTEGKGETDPIASNETDDGKALNRRVTIRLPEDQ